MTFMEKSLRVQLTFIFNHKYMHYIIFEHLINFKKIFFWRKKIDTLMLNQRPRSHCSGRGQNFVTIPKQWALVGLKEYFSRIKKICISKKSTDGFSRKSIKTSEKLIFGNFFGNIEHFAFTAFSNHPITSCFS